MINILLHSTIFSPSLLNKTLFVSFAFLRAEAFFLSSISLSPSHSLHPHLSQISCESISQQMKLFVYLFLVLKVGWEKRKTLWWRTLGQWTLILFLVQHFYWCIYGILPNSSAAGAEGKKDTLNMSGVIIFFDDGIKWKNGSDGSQT